MDLTAIIGIITPFLFAAWMIKLSHDRKMRENAMQTLGAEESRAIQEITEIARRMEQRVENLERILDNEVAGWRSRVPM